MSAATAFDDFIAVGGDRYRLGSDLVWDIGIKGSDWQLTIPAGFTFESSVPWWLRWIVSAHHRAWLLAAAIHDWLLELGFDSAFSAGEWLRAARAKRNSDDKHWLVLPAYYAVVLWTVR